MAGRGRFAPSPTGLLHLGNARTALLAWLDARAGGGTFVMRVEDLDRARVQPGAEAQQLDDLRWLGLDWDEGPDRGGPFAPYRQSDRTRFYDAAIDRLLAEGRAFLCACSRADVARAATAPHEGDGAGEPRYPGTCRGQDPATVKARAAAQGRAPAVRFDGRRELVGFADELSGPTQAEVDDFVLRRADGTAAYQLAVVVDDAAMQVTRVVRGGDLLSSTPRQIALGRALRLAIPAFAHVPLVVTPGGARLAKRTRPVSLKSLRDAGHRPEAIVGVLAASAGLGRGEPIPARELVAGFELSRVRREPAVVMIGQPGNTSG
ncbi:MAG TPA: tRNA glutamyl-Q(34) synthetase GluQRS [Polyangia bacterium]|nr:tRNA glutamyl-Q(34) synthetase GluQRS [Polyangia bacterium]